jgi:hypothetical protein
MDYSAVSSDSDALHGASPWGSSSPRADRSFPSPSDPPDSPAPIRGHSYSQSQDSVPESPYPPETPSEVSDSTLADSGVSQQTPYPPDSVQQGQPSQQDSQAPVVGQQQQYQQRPGAARYHGTKQQRPVAQYKLQAKVTALERTGRKDPVIRFDVHV